MQTICFFSRHPLTYRLLPYHTMQYHYHVIPYHTIPYRSTHVLHEPSQVILSLATYQYNGFADHSIVPIFGFLYGGSLSRVWLWWWWWWWWWRRRWWWWSCVVVVGALADLVHDYPPLRSQQQLPAQTLACLHQHTYKPMQCFIPRR